MTRLMHLADVHLGARLHGLDPYPGAPDVDPAQVPYDAFRAAIDRALDERYDAVLIAGDVFDRADDAGHAVGAVQRALDELHEAGIPVAMIAGNHDAEAALLARLRLAASATLFPADHAGTVIWEELGLAMHGQSIAERDDLRDLVPGYPAPIDGLRNVALLHTSLAGEWSNRDCAPTTPAALAASGHDYWALGHVHERRTVEVKPLAVYSGSTYGRRAGESGGRGYAEVLLDGDGVSAIPVDTAPVRYQWLSLGSAADQFAAESATDTIVVWTPDAEHTAGELTTARELALRYPNYLVAAR